MWPEEPKEYKIKGQRKLTDEDGNIMLTGQWLTTVDTPFGELCIKTFDKPSDKFIDREVSKAIFKKRKELENEPKPNQIVAENSN